MVTFWDIRAIQTPTTPLSQSSLRGSRSVPGPQVVQGEGLGLTNNLVLAVQ